MTISERIQLVAGILAGLVLGAVTIYIYRGL